MVAGGNHDHMERPGPAEFQDPVVRQEFKRAWVWIGSILAVAAVIFLAQPLLLIVGGLVFAVLLDGGARLLGRWLPIGRGWRLAIVTLAGFGFIGWVFYTAGATFAAQFAALQVAVEAQLIRFYAWGMGMGLFPTARVEHLSDLLKVLASGLGDGAVSAGTSGFGRVTSAIGGIFGALTSAFLILIIGIFFATEPKVYDRGVAWLLPVRHRASYYDTAAAVGFTLRRLLFGRLVGMVVEGFFTYLMLAFGGPLVGWMIGTEIQPVPMAALLGLLTGLFAFIPNIGAIVSGLLMVAVGFSAGTNEGVWAIVTYFAVQNIDGYLILPYIARKTVDLPPAMVLAAQLVFGALFGFLGLLLADPIMATLKVTLEKLARERSPGLTDPAEAPAVPRPGEAPGRPAVPSAPPHSGPPASP
ncbi:AI-2E family transporter [Sphingomonas astaxanthinifaciens]|uniref:AI-2E family transporter n=1 Tax=Sphingomonas astaxanthinifaciens DSM 22298 TaxID=1123267 RepID=A0ABQ5Z7J1_9SPHN|nr:AI-2E family transporter [Sphingomonas astaxanthinifaciens]GLR47942.1 AI-2E family transporter [Sphingomonas astaxanthinifaciens DSM 22298]